MRVCVLHVKKGKGEGSPVRMLRTEALVRHEGFLYGECLGEEFARKKIPTAMEAPAATMEFAREPR